MLSLAIGALVLAAVAVGIVMRGDDGNSSPAPLVSADSDAEELRQICGSTPATESPSFCIGRDRSISPSQLVIPGYPDREVAGALQSSARMQHCFARALFIVRNGGRDKPCYRSFHLGLAAGGR